MLTLDPYAARSCPVKTHNLFRPGLERPAPRSAPLGSRGGPEFVSSILQAVAAGQGAVADLRPLRDQPSQAQVEATLAAMERQTDVVIGALLPRDERGHRSGRPDLLIRHTSGYVPGLVRFQKLLDVRRDDTALVASPVNDLRHRETLQGYRYRWHWRHSNALHLAHFHRMLEAAGLAEAGTPWAVAIGTDETGGAPGPAVWLDLSEPAVPPAGGQDTASDAPVSALHRYDTEFAERVRIAERASTLAPGEPALLAPIVTRECNWCPWWEVCRPQLDDDDLSLRISKSPLDSHEITALRRAGISTVADLAKADLETLLPTYLPHVSHRLGGEDRLRLAQRRSVLLVDGVQLERTGTDPIPVPAAALEIDVDIETSWDDRVYLWGFWVSDPATGELGYRQFSDFSTLDAASETALAVAALSWLRDRVAQAEALVYHYSDYEVTRIARLADASDHPSLSWALEYAQTNFVDLFGIVRTNFFGTNGLSLKVVATHGAGFAWRDEDPGGLNSMHWFADAVNAPSAATRERARTRVLEYNEDDVKATWHLRRWLREQP
ncbi:MAG: TM0106 family RecB-like putative nuclease [Propionicimonas sp.]